MHEYCVLKQVTLYPHIHHFIIQVDDEVDEIVMCIVQNKIDLIEEATMTP